MNKKIPISILIIILVIVGWFYFARQKNTSFHPTINSAPTSTSTFKPSSRVLVENTDKSRALEYINNKVGLKIKLPPGWDIAAEEDIIYVGGIVTYDIDVHFYNKVICLEDQTRGTYTSNGCVGFEIQTADEPNFAEYDNVYSTRTKIETSQNKLIFMTKIKQQEGDGWPFVCDVIYPNQKLAFSVMADNPNLAKNIIDTLELTK